MAHHRTYDYSQPSERSEGPSFGRIQAVLHADTEGVISRKFIFLRVRLIILQSTNVPTVVKYSVFQPPDFLSQSRLSQMISGGSSGPNDGL